MVFKTQYFVSFQPHSWATTSSCRHRWCECHYKSQHCILQQCSEIWNTNAYNQSMCSWTLEKGSTLSDCWYAFDTLIGHITGFRRDTSSDLYDCKLWKSYIEPRARVVTHSDFEYGIVNIQREETESLTDAEKQACESLIISPLQLSCDKQAVSRKSNESLQTIIQDKKCPWIFTHEAY